MAPHRRSDGELRFIRLQEQLHRAVDAVVYASRRAHGPDAVSAFAFAELELAMLEDLVHAMRIDGERKPMLRNSRPTHERMSLY
jgi:hypothetical protein